MAQETATTLAGMLLGMLLLQVTAGGAPPARAHAAAPGTCLGELAPLLVVRRAEAPAAAGVSGGWQAPLDPRAP